jgi:hypothetical protein
MDMEIPSTFDLEVVDIATHIVVHHHLGLLHPLVIEDLRLHHLQIGLVLPLLDRHQALALALPPLDRHQELALAPALAWD